MHPYIDDLQVRAVLDERRRQATPRRTHRRGGLVRRAGDGLVAAGAALSATGRRLQDPGPSAPCVAC